MLGGLDGFAGLRLTERRGDHELFAALLFRWPVYGRLLARIEPMVGVTGNGGFLRDPIVGDLKPIFGARIGGEFETPIGPVRVEQGFSGSGRRQALIRIGHWF